MVGGEYVDPGTACGLLGDVVGPSPGELDAAPPVAGEGVGGGSCQLVEGLTEGGEGCGGDGDLDGGLVLVESDQDRGPALAAVLRGGAAPSAGIGPAIRVGDEAGLRPGRGCRGLSRDRKSVV